MNDFFEYLVSKTGDRDLACRFMFRSRHLSGADQKRYILKGIKEKWIYNYTMDEEGNEYNYFRDNFFGYSEDKRSGLQSIQEVLNDSRDLRD